MTKKKIVLLSPHPDDECLNALFPLRLKGQFQVHNLAMTLGSNIERQKAREKELKNACDKLGFVNHIANFHKSTVDLINQLNPLFVLAPHSEDHHPTHIKVFDFLKNNLNIINAKYIILSEYWFPMKSPNLMLEASRDQIDLITAALRCHEGEMQRSHYDRSYEAWLIDCARRGNEYLPGYGQNKNNFKYANLYTVLQNKNGRFSNFGFKKCVSVEEDLSQVFSSHTI